MTYLIYHYVVQRDQLGIVSDTGDMTIVTKPHRISSNASEVSVCCPPILLYYSLTMMICSFLPFNYSTSKIISIFRSYSRYGTTIPQHTIEPQNQKYYWEGLGGNGPFVQTLYPFLFLPKIPCNMSFALFLISEHTLNYIRAV